MTNRNFYPFPILTTERLTLRQLSTDDQESIFALRSDEEINKYIERQPASSIDDALNFIDKVIENIKNNNSVYWAITLTNTSTFVGTICLFNFLNENNSCEIGYELLKKFQGQGIMKEAVKKVVSYAFQTLQFQEIVGVVHEDNLNSIRLLEQNQFVKSANENQENTHFYTYTLGFTNWLGDE